MVAILKAIGLEVLEGGLESVGASIAPTTIMI
jgi:hypothetical protein